MCLNSTTVFAQLKENVSYNQPAADILEIMRAPFLRLAGVRLEPGNRSRHDTPGGYGIPSCARTFTLFKVSGVVLNPMLGSEAQWMPDQNHRFDLYVKNAGPRKVVGK